MFLIDTPDLRNDFGNISETAVNLEQKVESAKNEIDMQYRAILNEAEERIVEMTEQHHRELSKLRASIPKQFAFGKKLKGGCSDGHACHSNSRLMDKIDMYDESLYSIGAADSLDGVITIMYSGLYQFEVAIRLRSSKTAPKTSRRNFKGMPKVKNKYICHTVAAK